MIRALWIKSFRDGRWLLLGSALMLFAFQWIRVWITSQVETAGVRKLLSFAPDFVKEFIVVPLEVLAAPAGRIAVGYDDPLVVVIVSIWAIARGSDLISGEIGRGTMEMLLAQPIRRIHLFLTQTSVTVLGLILIVASAWLGTYVGLQLITLEEAVPAKIYLAPASNLLMLGFFLAGLSSCLSAMDRYRSRTIGLVVGFFVLQMVVKLVSVAVVWLRWLRYCSFVTAFEPQKLAYYFWPEMLAQYGDQSWQLLLQYNGLLFALGLVGYVAAAIIFCQRDLPAPL